jgi:uncharacterized protein YhbP (UPF0306 family)
MLMTYDVKALIQDILERGCFMSLATLDEQGVWVSDLLYVHDDDFNLYWLSRPEARHSGAILAHPKVAGTITVSGRGEDNLGIQFEGIGKRLKGSRFDLLRKKCAKGNRPAPKEEDDLLQGDSWYVVKPTRIDLICEARFGYEKQRIDLS